MNKWLGHRFKKKYLNNLEDLEPIRLRKEKKTVIQGIYFLFKGDELVYIGKSVNIYGRVNSHDQDDWDTYSYIEVDGYVRDFELSKLEKAYQLKYRPRYNKIDKLIPIEGRSRRIKWV